MLTFIAFALTIAGCVNWLMIGLLQYDFVAGIFGYQGSVFSRLIYIVIGAAAVFLVVKLFVEKGSIHVWGGKKKKIQQMRENYAHSNIEASKEQSRKHESGYHDSEEEHDYQASSHSQNQQISLFDEHFDDK